MLGEYRLRFPYWERPAASADCDSYNVLETVDTQTVAEIDFDGALAALGISTTACDAWMYQDAAEANAAVIAKLKHKVTPEPVHLLKFRRTSACLDQRWH